MLVVYNPVAPKFDFDRDLSRFSRHKPDYFRTTGKDDKQKLKNLFDKKKYDLVVVIGGDGTLNLVASFLVNTGVKLAIIPKGSTNGLFYDLASEDLPLSKRKTKRVDVIKIGKDYCFHLADFGFNARIIKESRHTSIKGFFKYFFGFFKSLFDFKRYVFKINGEKIKKNLLVIANGRGYGGRFKINPLGKMDDGLFEVCTLHTRKSFRRVKIINHDKSPFHIDGEFKGHPRKVLVSIEDKSLMLLI